MPLGGKVPAEENKKICQMVTTTIWHQPVEKVRLGI